MHLIPSRRRISNLKNLCKSLKETETSTPGLVIVDAKDYMENSEAYTDLEINHFLPNWKLYISKGESMGDKVQEMWPMIQKLDWVSLENDDHYMITHEWDKKLIARLNGKNFVTCNDNWLANGLSGPAAGATIWSGDLLRTVGYIFPNGLQHTFIDRIWEHLGRATGCWEVDMSVTIEHRHVSKGEAPEDETHKRMQKFFHTDGPIYLEWVNSEYEKAAARIRELQHGQLSVVR